MKSRWKPRSAAALPSVAAVLPSFVAALLLLPFASTANAQEDAVPGCPPGEWFCDDTPPEPAPQSPRGDDTYPEGSALPEPEQIPGDAAPDDGDIEVFGPAPVDSTWSQGSGGKAVSPWGLALRAQGVILEGKRGSDASLGGIGISGRYTLTPVVTFDLGLDSILGTDYSGYDRSELMLSFSSLFYLNSHPVVRTYVLVGLNASRAYLDFPGDEQTWGYFGGQAGLGLEFSLDRLIALNVDFVGFIRGRTDERAAREPEFTDAQGRVTNTSGGGLLRAGMVLRF
jgi:hypothetical protein